MSRKHARKTFEGRCVSSKAEVLQHYPDAKVLHVQGSPVRVVSDYWPGCVMGCGSTPTTVWFAAAAQMKMRHRELKEKKVSGF